MSETTAPLDHVRGDDGHCVVDGKWVGPPASDPWWLGLDDDGRKLTGSASANWTLMMTLADGPWADHLCPVERQRRVSGPRA